MTLIIPPDKPIIRRNHKPRRYADRKRRTQMMIGAAVLSLASFTSGVYFTSQFIGPFDAIEQERTERG